MDRWQSDAFTSPEIARVIKQDLLNNLKYTHHSLFDWRPFPGQLLPTVQINSFGLRSSREFQRGSGVNCVLLGGSFAWGFGASSNEHAPGPQISAGLTERTGRSVDVVTLADQNYCSIQEIKSFIFCVDEAKPDVVLCITGVNDIGRGLVNAFKRDPRYVAASEFLNWGIQVGLTSERVNKFPSWKKAAKVFLRDQRVRPYPGDEFFTLSKPAQEDIPHTLQRQKAELLAAVCIHRNIKLIFVLQPMIYSKKHHSPYEREYIRYSISDHAEYVEFYKYHYSVMRDRFEARSRSSTGDALFIDSASFLDDCDESAFFDGMHLSDRGNAIWCEALSKRVAQVIERDS